MNNIIKLTDAEKERVMQADDRFGPYAYDSTVKRFYVISRKRTRIKDDIIFILCAVYGERLTTRIEAIGITSVMSDRSYFSGRIEIIQSMYSYVPNKIELCSEDEVGCIWTPRDQNIAKSFWTRPIDLPDSLDGNLLFKYCALPKWGVNALDWLRLYMKYPEIEMFSKMNMIRLAIPRFMDKMRKDVAFKKYVFANREGIIDQYLLQSQIEYAFRHGLTPKQMRDKINLDAEVKIIRKDVICYWRDAPKDTDWHKVAKFIKKTRISAWEYSKYIKFCIAGGADIRDENTAFPPNIEHRLKVFEEQRIRMEQKECEEKLIAVAKRLLARMKKVKSDDYTVVIPNSPKMFVEEGKAMNNCVGGGNYASSMAAGYCVCVFIRKKDEPDKPFVDVEINGKRVVQCRVKNNKEAPKNVKAFAKELANAFYVKPKRKAA